MRACCRTTCRAAAGWRSLLVAIVVALALTPFVFPGTKALNVAAKMIVFIVLAASFDLLLGYTGIVSFAHTMFFGIGAYGVAIAATRIGPSWPALGARHRRRRSRSRSCSRSSIGLFSLRVRAIFFAMITLAVASRVRDARLAARRTSPAARTASPSSCPRRCSRAPPTRASRCWARRSTAASSPTTCCSSPRSSLVLLLLRIVNSPFGRVLQAIRENDFRAEAIGYRTVVYRTLASVVSALFATLAGVAARALAALQRPRHDALVRDHARRAADRRHRRHGHDLRRGHRQRAARAGAELPAGPDEARRRRGAGRAGAGADRLARPLAALARRCCSCSRSTTSRAAIVGRLRTIGGGARR